MSRKIGHVFAVFFYGRWRVAIQGPHRSNQVFEQAEVVDDFPWDPPVTLLGSTSCLGLLDDAEQAEALKRLIQPVLSPRVVQTYASIMAQAARDCLTPL